MTPTLTVGLTAGGRVARTALPVSGCPDAWPVTALAGTLPDRSPPGRETGRP